jgi:hypothetical protein
MEIVKCFGKPRVTCSSPLRLSDAGLNMVARGAAQPRRGFWQPVNSVID